MIKSIWFDNKVRRSSAYRSLSKWSMLVYLDFLSKRKMEKVKHAKRSDGWIIKNNGEIVYPYIEAEHKGIGRREFRNAIDELIEKGFLDITHQGSGGRAGDMTRYFIDDRWKDYGKSLFRPAKNPRRKDTRKGRGWSAYHAKKEKSSVADLIPEKAVSSNKSATPNEQSQILSSNRFDTPKEAANQVTIRDGKENGTATQLSLWSNIFVTILKIPPFCILLANQ